jgi:alpha-methylacyl-CoA racemase
MLAGLKIIEFEGIGPGPLAGLILAEMGAEVTLIARKGGNALARQLKLADGPHRLNRGKKRLELDLKSPEGIAAALDLIGTADALIEGNRPGVMERLGLSPAACLARNPKLVFGRMTGWGQSGPLAQAAGHDLNYVALTGLMGLGGGRLPPPRPPATLGDAAGALGLAFGIMCAIFAAQKSGRGHVVDAAIVDIVSMLGTIARMLADGGQIGGETPSAFYESPFYDIYECADGAWISIGCLEPQFYRLLLEKLELGDVDPAKQYDTAEWPALKERLILLFRGQPRQHWCELLEGTDVCFAPVLTLQEAAAHPHNKIRGDGPAPRFS